MWGLAPARSAVLTKDLFAAKKVQTVLVPGMGYGRNAKIFYDAGMVVTGIEVSGTAVALAEKNFGKTMRIHHGSVIDMPFDNRLFDGIYCHALIHLLDIEERVKLIADCYSQLSDNGYMVFTAITREAKTYGQGQPIGKHRFEMFGGVKMFFYDRYTIREEFGEAGLVEITTVEENYPFYMIQCRKTGK